MTVDPVTGLVEQGYRAVNEVDYGRAIAAYPVKLHPVDDDTLDIDGWEDPTRGPYPEGLVGFRSRRTGLRYVRDEEAR
jgi:hypothetical protein